MAELSALQEKTIAALLSEPTIEAAAKRIGISARTINEWMRTVPEFEADYRAARREAVQQAITRLQQSSSEAAGVLIALMRNTRAPSYARLAAASKVLDMAVKAVELDDIMARLEALEANYAQKL